MLSTAVIFCSANHYGYGYGHPIDAAVYSHHDIQVVPVKSYGYSKPVYVQVPGSANPIFVNFQTQSSPLYVKQNHHGMKGTYQHSASYDEPHKLVHLVTKPVIQELHEVIKPYRKIVQKIEPVHEQMLTLVHKAAEYGGHGYGKAKNGYEGKHGYGHEEKYGGYKATDKVDYGHEEKYGGQKGNDKLVYGQEDKYTVYKANDKRAYGHEDKYAGYNGDDKRNYAYDKY